MNTINLINSNEYISTPYNSYGVDMINSSNINKNGYTGKGVTIAILDTGIDFSHTIFTNIKGKNFTPDDLANADKFNDYNGHGTHVSGIIKSVAPDVNLLIVKVLDKNGQGSYEGIVQGIEYAISQKVNIISMSLGGKTDYLPLHDVIKKAIDNNILVVCASGNEGNNTGSRVDEYAYPGSYNEVIEVGALDQNYNVTGFSNSNMFVDLVAPGYQINSTFLNGSCKTMSGTSQATPFVSGALALIIEWSIKEFKRPLLESEIYAQLIKNTKDLNVDRKLQGNGYLYLNIK